LNSALATEYGPWKVLHSQLPLALRRETPTRYPDCIMSASK